MGLCIKSEHETVGTPPEHNRQLPKKNTVCECEMALKCAYADTTNNPSQQQYCYKVTQKHTRGTQQ